MLVFVVFDLVVSCNFGLSRDMIMTPKI